MNLHRTTGKPDWQTIRKQDRNPWQQIAGQTGGVVTPGNAVTVIGLILVIAGLISAVQGNYWNAGALIIAGRLMDLVDGWLADITRTKSPLGELMDASVDKVETFAAITVMYYTVLAPWWLLTLLLLPHAVITVFALKARRQGYGLHPSRAGKISMALLWVSLFGFLATHIFAFSGLMAAAVYALTAACILLTTWSAVDYGRQLRSK